MILILALGLLAAEPTPLAVQVPKRDAPVSYAKEVADVLGGKCVGCHGGALKESKLDLEEVAGMLKGGKRGPAIVPGKADDSLLFRMAAHRVEPVMPPTEKKEAKSLTPEELGLLKLWIDAGAKDDSAEVAESETPIELGDLPPGVQPIVAVDLTADGKRVAAGRGNRVYVYDVDSGAEVASLGGHRDIIQSIRFSPDGRRLAAGSYRVVTVWDAPEGESKTWAERKPLGPHSGRVLALDFNADGTLLAAGGGEPSRSGQVRVWEVGKGLPVFTLDGLHSDTVFGLRFSPTGRSWRPARRTSSSRWSTSPTGRNRGRSKGTRTTSWRSTGSPTASRSSAAGPTTC